MIKFYDTNSLLLMPDEILNNKIAISSITLQELESIKTNPKKDIDVKAMARKLSVLLDDGSIKYNVQFYNSKAQKIAEDFDIEITPDAKILACAIAYAKSLSEKVTFVTNDICLKNFAKELTDLPVESVNDEDNYVGYEEVFLNADELGDLYEDLTHDPFGLYNGEYLIVCDEDGNEIDRMCKTPSGFRRIRYTSFTSEVFNKVEPYKGDVYQALAMDSLVSNQVTMLKGPAGSGKAQPNSTLLPTKNGYKKLGDIRVGDKVLDRFGKETTVLAVYPQGLKDNYKITFSDGRIAYCNNEHLWSCYTSKGHLKNFTVQEMIDSGLQTKGGDWRYKIPISAPVEYEEKDFDVDPYVIGVFLGDGCCKERSLTLSSSDEEIVKEVSRLIGAVQYSRSNRNNYSWIFYEKEKTGINGGKTRFQTREVFKNYLTSLCVSAQEKSIPNEYKFGSINQRYSLLQGLMDTDGHIDNAVKGRTHFTSTSIQLIKDVQEICWSLGMSANISEDHRADKYTNNICYDLMISCDKKDKPKLFRLTRKKDIAIQYANNNIHSIHSNTLTIKKIEKMNNPEEMTCILVDNDEHLYLTEEYIVTHNTYLALSYLFHLLEYGDIDKIIIFCNTIATRDAAKLGYYPGEKDEKLLDSHIGNVLASKLGSKEEVIGMINREELLLLPMSDIRGFDTSGMRAGVYITEAQNMSIDLMKLALQRLGEDCKMILDGDSKTQVDLAAYEGANNGMKRASKIFRGTNVYGEVELGIIHRSEVARIAEDM